MCKGTGSRNEAWPELQPQGRGKTAGTGQRSRACRRWDTGEAQDGREDGRGRSGPSRGREAGARPQGRPGGLTRREESLGQGWGLGTDGPLWGAGRKWGNGRTLPEGAAGLGEQLSSAGTSCVQAAWSRGLPLGNGPKRLMRGRLPAPGDSRSSRKLEKGITQGAWTSSLGAGAQVRAFIPVSQVKTLRFREGQGLTPEGQSEDFVGDWLGRSREEAPGCLDGGKSFPEVGTPGQDGRRPGQKNAEERVWESSSSRRRPRATRKFV